MRCRAFTTAPRSGRPGSPVSWWCRMPITRTPMPSAAPPWKRCPRTTSSWKRTLSCTAGRYRAAMTARCSTNSNWNCRPTSGSAPTSWIRP
ncbi:hypothetical protein G6F55_014528 [Rhizopus delemar]|nr:hypothetical protein G6F55_014528 [Rhizopus delemar]